MSKSVYSVVKRLMDICAALLLLILLSPILLVVCVLIRKKIGSPILFTQSRPGLHGRIFEIRKFRTMTMAVDGKGMLLPDAERLNSFGRMLRSSSIDELPSLYNILRGDLSLVGPRPLLPEYLELYSTEQARRHNVVPGLTGWAQIKGRNSLSWEEKFELDNWYVDNRSFYLDTKILILTVVKVIRKDGISADGHVTMAPFTGSEK